MGKPDELIDGGIHVTYKCANCNKEFGILYKCGLSKREPRVSKVTLDDATGNVVVKLAHNKELYPIPQLRPHICEKGHRMRGIAYISCVDDWHWATEDELIVFLQCKSDEVKE
jgi:hypothetical protein